MKQCTMHITQFLHLCNRCSLFYKFLLWQASYAELYFPEVLWPDFTEEEFDRAMEEYARRDRRFGLVK